ncbi:MAG: acetyl-coenzyme A synthetase N-terminal domain-containing protein, partial [Candidatus Thermoplasmatota archaeon]|nr:acetyl-coenzyme A synthetase N-terminal domain-containing protein [Candidatus Thermoplasmatota archaeon]
MVKVFPPPKATSERAHISSLDAYQKLYGESVSDPESFWAEQAQRISWSRKWNRVRNCDYRTAKIAWFEGGKLNACYNCVDRHVEAGHGDANAIVWEGNDPDESRSFSYTELHVEVQRAANALKALGIGKGDRVCIYLQMVPELA